MTPYDESRYREPFEPGRGGAPRRRGLVNRHPIIANLIIIIVVAVLGLVIAYLSLGLFTKHGQTDQVPRLVNMSYSSAVEKLHSLGFNVEIKDSVYFEDVRPGVVVDQFPATGAIVKPGRKVYLYINSVHPKEVIVDQSSGRGPAMKEWSKRQAQAQLQELGFKKISIEYVHGTTDRVLRVTANGKTVNKMQKVPLNAKIVIVVYDNNRSSAASQPVVTANDTTQADDVLIETAPGFVPDEEQYFEEEFDDLPPVEATE